MNFWKRFGIHIAQMTMVIVGIFGIIFFLGYLMEYLHDNYPKAGAWIWVGSLAGGVAVISSACMAAEEVKRSKKSNE